MRRVMGSGEERVLMGVVVAPHGVRGEVRIKSYAATPEDIASYGPLEDATGERELTLAVRRGARGTLIARLSGTADRSAAEALRGVKLYLPRARLGALADDEFYHADLIGLSASLPSGELFGRIIAVHDFGAGPLLEIATAGRASALVPFSLACVPRVDPEGGCVVIDPPAELLSEDAA